MALAALTAVVVLASLPLAALAEESANPSTPQQFAVLPFAINGPEKYQYLAAGLQDMLMSRLFWQDKLHPAAKSAIQSLGSSKDLSDDKAASVIRQGGLDYLVWGSATIMGEECSLDVKVMDRVGKLWAKSAQTNIDKLIPSMERLARQVNNEVLKRPTLAQSPLGESAAEEGPTKMVNQMNPGLVPNETDRRTEYYLNPQFRYAGDSSTEGRKRSQSLGYSAIGMAVGDADHDGQSEIFVIEETKIHAYRMDAEGQLAKLGEHEIGGSKLNLGVSLVDANRDGYLEIVVSAALKTRRGRNQKWDEYTPRSYVLNFKADKFEMVQDEIQFYIGVIKTPPEYMPTMVGQKQGRRSLFDNGVYMVSKAGGDYTLGSRLKLPSEANVFNAAFVPQDLDSYKIMIIDERDHLRVYTDTLERQYTSDKVYSGSSLGLEYDESIYGVRDQVMLKPKYYLPVRMLPGNLDGGERHELLVNSPISVASQFFDRYRFFPEGEIHCVYWDGVGMSLVWKTRRIKGSVVDLGMGDIDNDGVEDLFTLVNTHPGPFGVKQRRGVILTYPLDVSKQGAVQGVDQEFLDEEHPGQPSSQ